MRLIKLVIGVAIAGLILAGVGHTWILPFTPRWFDTAASIGIVAAILTALVIWNRACDDWDLLKALVVGGTLAYVIYGALI